MGSSMVQIIHQLHFQPKVFLRILLGYSSKRSSRRSKRKVSPMRRQRNSRQTSMLSSRWLWGGSLITVMLIWNWQLLFATLAGIGVLVLLSRFPIDRWSLYWQKWQQQINLPQRRLLIAVIGSGIAGIGTYWGVNLWQELNNPWLASGAIAQGVLLTILLAFQSSKLFTTSPSPHPFSEMLGDLTAENPLKRLMAIRELTQLAIRGNLHADQLKQVNEYFSLLFSVETKPIVRQGLLESMQTLQLNQCWHKWENQSRQPLKNLQKSKKVRFSQTQSDKKALTLGNGD